MRINRYPTKGKYDGDRLPEYERERLLENLTKYYKLMSIFGSIMFGMSIVASVGLAVSIVGQLNAAKESGDQIGTMVASVSAAMQAFFMGFFVFGMYKFFRLPRKAIKEVEKGNFTYSKGEVTDKIRSEKSDTTLYIDDIPCTDLMRDYRAAKIGREYYIIYIKKIRFAMPCE